MRWRTTRKNFGRFIILHYENILSRMKSSLPLHWQRTLIKSSQWAPVQQQRFELSIFCGSLFWPWLMPNGLTKWGETLGLLLLYLVLVRRGHFLSVVPSTWCARPTLLPSILFNFLVAVLNTTPLTKATSGKYAIASWNFSGTDKNMPVRAFNFYLYHLVGWLVG